MQADTTVPVTVWSPPGSTAGRPLPLLVAHDGPEYAEYSSLVLFLAGACAAGDLPPLRAALVPPVARNRDYSASAVNRLVRRVRKRARVTPAVVAKRWSNSRARSQRLRVKGLKSGPAGATVPIIPSSRSMGSPAGPSSPAPPPRVSLLLEIYSVYARMGARRTGTVRAPAEGAPDRTLPVFEVEV